MCIRGSACASFFSFLLLLLLPLPLASCFFFYLPGPLPSPMHHRVVILAVSLLSSITLSLSLHLYLCLSFILPLPTPPSFRLFFICSFLSASLFAALSSLPSFTRSLSYLPRRISREYACLSLGGMRTRVLFLRAQRRFRRTTKDYKSRRKNGHIDTASYDRLRTG